MWFQHWEMFHSEICMLFKAGCWARWKWKRSFSSCSQWECLGFAWAKVVLVSFFHGYLGPNVLVISWFSVQLSSWVILGCFASAVLPLIMGWLTPILHNSPCKQFCSHHYSCELPFFLGAFVCVRGTVHDLALLRIYPPSSLFFFCVQKWFPPKMFAECQDAL